TGAGARRGAADPLRRAGLLAVATAAPGNQPGLPAPAALCTAPGRSQPASPGSAGTLAPRPGPTPAVAVATGQRSGRRPTGPSAGEPHRGIGAGHRRRPGLLAGAATAELPVSPP